MGSKYNFGENPFRDILLNAIIEDVNIANKSIKKNIHETFAYILKNVLEDENLIVYLNFEIVNDYGYFNILPNNILTAFWLSGILPDDAEKVLNSNNLIIGDRKYKFNKKKRELTNTKIDD